MSTFTVILAVALGMRFSTTAMGAVLDLAILWASMATFCGVGIAFAALVIVFKRGKTLAATAVVLAAAIAHFSTALHRVRLTGTPWS